MIVEALLAFVHLAAILALVVFLTSEAALCRAEWMNTAVVQRLVRVDKIYLVALAVTGASGLARTLWGVKGAGWYLLQPLWVAKLALFVVVVVLAVKPARAFRRWQRELELNGVLPPVRETAAVRRRLMLASHLIVLPPLAAVLLARGIGTV